MPTLWQSLCGPPRGPRAGHGDERAAENNAIESLKEGAVKNRRRHPWTHPARAASWRARVLAECQWSRWPATAAEITFSATPDGRAGASTTAVFPTRRTHPAHHAAPLPPRTIHDDRTGSRHAAGSFSPTLGHERDQADPSSYSTAARFFHAVERAAALPVRRRGPRHSSCCWVLLVFTDFLHETKKNKSNPVRVWDGFFWGRGGAGSLPVGYTNRLEKA